MKYWQSPISQFTGVVIGMVVAFGTVGCSSQPNPGLAGPATALAPATNEVEAALLPGADRPPLQRLEPASPRASPALAEIIKLIQSGVDESVVLAFIDNTTTPFDPSADDILYLNDLGVSSKVITALLRQSKILRKQMSEADDGAPPVVIAPTPADAGVPGSSPEAATLVAPAELAAVPVTEAQEASTLAAAPAPIVVNPAPVYVLPQPATVFYNDLAYGSWMELEDYGWCWQPTTVIVNRGWRPYGDGGHWLYTDCGWYWQSDYTWGWAPFHYGRWLNHRRIGWVWTPDTLWGPSWVSWRYYPSYCGWAPLPPGTHFGIGLGWTYHNVHVGNDFDFGLSFGLFTFLPLSHFGDRHPHRYFVRPDQNHDFLRRSTVVNHYVRGSDQRIINEGIGRERVAAFAGNKYRPVPVRELPSAAGRTLKPDRLEREGNNLVIYRPPPSAVRPPSTVISTGSRGALETAQDNRRGPATVLAPNQPARPATASLRSEPIPARTSTAPIPGRSIERQAPVVANPSPRRPITGSRSAVPALSGVAGTSGTSSDRASAPETRAPVAAPGRPGTLPASVSAPVISRSSRPTPAVRSSPPPESRTVAPAPSMPAQPAPAPSLVRLPGGMPAPARYSPPTTITPASAPATRIEPATASPVWRSPAAGVQSSRQPASPSSARTPSRNVGSAVGGQAVQTQTSGSFASTWRPPASTPAYTPPAVPASPARVQPTAPSPTWTSPSVRSSPSPTTVQPVYRTPAPSAPSVPPTIRSSPSPPVRSYTPPASSYSPPVMRSQPVAPPSVRAPTVSAPPPRSAPPSSRSSSATPDSGNRTGRESRQ